MNSVAQTDAPKRTSRHSWIMFAVGISLVPIGGIVWTAITGVSPWLSPHREFAERVVWVFIGAAYALCVFAALFAPISLARRLGLGVLAAAAVLSVQFICAFIHLLLIGV